VSSQNTKCIFVELLLFFVKWYVWHCPSSMEYWSLFIICKYLYQYSYREVRGCERGFAWVAWLLINISRIGVKVRVGLEKIIYENFVIWSKPKSMTNYLIFQDACLFGLLVSGYSSDQTKDVVLSLIRLSQEVLQGYYHSHPGKCSFF